MYFGDHAPPHFHAEYAGAEAVIEIETLKMLAGDLPSRRESSSRNGPRCTKTTCARSGGVRRHSGLFRRSSRCYSLWAVGQKLGLKFARLQVLG